MLSPGFSFLYYFLDKTVSGNDPYYELKKKMFDIVWFLQCRVFEDEKEEEWVVGITLQIDGEGHRRGEL